MNEEKEMRKVSELNDSLCGNNGKCFICGKSTDALVFVDCGVDIYLKYGSSNIEHIVKYKKSIDLGEADIMLDIRETFK